MMEAVRDKWTDERLDDLNAKVDRGFERVDADLRALRVETRTEFGALRGEMKAGFERVDARFEKMDERFEKIDERFGRMEERMDERFEALHRLLFRAAAVLIVALVGLNASPF
jgi:hypothetical protein